MKVYIITVYIVHKGTKLKSLKMTTVVKDSTVIFQDTLSDLGAVVARQQQEMPKH